MEIDELWWTKYRGSADGYQSISGLARTSMDSRLAEVSVQ